MTANNQTESKPVQAVAITAIGSKFTFHISVSTLLRGYRWFYKLEGGRGGFGGFKQLIQSFKGKEIMGVGNNINLNPCQSGKF